MPGKTFKGRHVQTIVLGATTALSLTLAMPADAQLAFVRGPLELTVDGYANLTGAHNSGEDNAANPKGDAARLDAGLRLLALSKAGAGFKVGARIELLSSKEDKLEVGERSLLVIGGWGRLELGKRRGLPNVLSGYAPNGYTFTSAEFGLSSGRTLDPGGTLPTSFLSPGLARRIDRISSLGFAATLFDDRSGKLIYASPKSGGWEGGVSFSPRAEEQGGRYRGLLQAGLVREHYFGEHVLRVGGSYTRAEGARDVASDNEPRNLHSASGGATLVLNNELYVGASLTYDGRSRLPRAAPPPSGSKAFGYATSVNYNTGPWTLGSYYQQASAADDPAGAGQNRFRAVQLGASYRLSTKLRLYGAWYHYRFTVEGVQAADRFSGRVLLAGVRVTL